MATSLTIKALEQMNPLRLAGPLFDKELRVASRRRRFYALRFAYVCLFGVVVVYTWLVVTHPGRNSTPLVWASRMSEVGKIITAAIVWFQFIAAQILAAVLLGGAMAAEIRQRTLDVLFTTPISNVQIVMGKLLSGLLQIVLLLAISLPLLAIVRVFGGVPWDFVVSGLGVTLATAIFIGSLSLFVGITDRQAYPVAMNVLVLCSLFWICSGILCGTLMRIGHLNRTLATSIVILTDPYVLLFSQTHAMLTPSRAGQVSAPWIYCLAALGAAGGMVLLCVWRLRKAAAGTRINTSRVALPDRPEKPGRFRWLGRRAIRPVTGSPIVWKELCRPRVPRNRRGIWSAIFLAIAVCLVIACLVVIIVFEPKSLPSVCLGLAGVTTLIFGIDVASSAAGAIPREKEACTWPILLTTSLDDGEIIRGKAIGAVRRSLPLLAIVPVLVVTALLFSPADEDFFWQALYVAAMSVAHFVGALVFLVGLGLHVGTRAKTVTTAVVITIGVYIVTRTVIGPFLMMLVMALGAVYNQAGGFFLIAGAIVSAMLYAGMGVLLARSAAGRLRQKVFS